MTSATPRHLTGHRVTAVLAHADKVLVAEDRHDARPGPPTGCRPGRGGRPLKTGESPARVTGERVPVLRDRRDEIIKIALHRGVDDGVEVVDPPRRLGEVGGAEAPALDTAPPRLDGGAPSVRRRDPQPGRALVREVEGQKDGASGEPYSLEMLTPLVEEPHEAVGDLLTRPCGLVDGQVVRIADVPIGAQAQHQVVVDVTIVDALQAQWDAAHGDDSSLTEVFSVSVSDGVRGAALFLALWGTGLGVLT